jgi:FAD/FMN-containing dehydrogenase
MAPPLSHDPYSVLDQEYFSGCGAVYPADTDDVVTIVKWANQYKIPLWTISIGRNVRSAFLLMRASCL